MRVTKCDFPPGIIGIISSDLSRFPAFTISLLSLLVPPGTGWKWVRGNGFASNRNLIIKGMTPEHRWAWFIDDDHTFEADILMRLLHRNVDIVQPMVSTRKPPFQPYAYMRNPDIGYHSLQWSDLPENGLHPVDAVGAGGVLIRREVIDEIGDPWFEEGKIGAGSLGEDLYFMQKAKENGHQSFIDCEARIGHIGTHEVWPHFNEGKWCIDLDLLHNVVVRVDANIGINTAFAED